MSLVNLWLSQPWPVALVGGNEHLLGLYYVPGTGSPLGLSSGPLSTLRPLCSELHICSPI